MTEQTAGGSSYQRLRACTARSRVALDTGDGARGVTQWSICPSPRSARRKAEIRRSPSFRTALPTPLCTDYTRAGIGRSTIRRADDPRSRWGNADSP